MPGGKSRRPQQSSDSAQPTWSAGWRPDRQGPDRPAGPYAHVSTMNSGSIQAGAGLLSHKWGNGAAIDAMSANAELGLMGDPGSRRLGGKANAQMFKGQTPDNFPIGGEMGVFDASAEASIGEDGATLGAGANVIDGAVRLGENKADRANDVQARLGLGYGVGAAGRLHWGDSDKDGHREYGFGADVGPVSFDLKTEDPLMTALSMTPLGMMAGGLGGQLLGEETGLIPKDFNLTDTVVGGVKSAWNWLWGD